MLDRATDVSNEPATERGWSVGVADPLGLGVRVLAAATAARSMDEALRGAAELLGRELGCTGTRCFRISDITGSHIAPDRSMVRIAVRRDGQPVAGIELVGVAQAVDATALAKVLEITRLALELWAQREPANDAALSPPALSREFAEVIDGSLFISDPERSRFHFLTDQNFDTWGLTREQFAAHPKSLFEVVIDEDRHIVVDRMARERAGQPCDVSFRIQHPTKGLRWLRSRTHSLPSPDGVARVYGIVSDVTAERQRETELECARDAAEAASRAKSQFMANMNHEIRTPMNGILGMTELLLGTPLSDPQQRFAQAVYSSGESLLEIINDILDFSKIEAGKLTLAPADFLLRSVAQDTLELLAHQADAKGLALSLLEQPGLPAVVHGDALRLRQVLTHLVANAIKFTDHGDVVVELHRGQASTAGAPLQIAFRVRDTGIGIEAEALSQLFSAFTQGQAGATKRYGGTGLGLAIVRQLVDLMGGSVTVQSASGIGSEFTVNLPFQAAREAGFAPLAAEPVRRAERRHTGQNGVAAQREPVESGPALDCDVLVVEDNAVNRQVIDQMLRGLGCRPHLSSGAMEGLRALCEKRFDLVLMDIQMPGMDGTEALRCFRRGPSSRFAFATPADTPVVAVTANALVEDETRLRALGFDDYVSKPFRRSQLFAMLSRHLNSGTSGTSGSPAAPSRDGQSPAAEAEVVAGSAAPAPEVLDAAALERLRELDPKGENQLLQRVLSAFQTSIARLVPQVREASAADDLTGVRHVAHTLKSSSASIGAMKLAQMCGEIESMIRLDKVESLVPRVDAMCVEIDTVLQALRQLLDDKK